jgi:hypothetical protein
VSKQTEEAEGRQRGQAEERSRKWAEEKGERQARRSERARSARGATAATITTVGKGVEEHQGGKEEKAAMTGGGATAKVDAKVEVERAALRAYLLSDVFKVTSGQEVKAAEIQMVFKAFDDNGDGTIERAEFCKAAVAMGFAPDSEELEMAVKVGVMWYTRTLLSCTRTLLSCTHTLPSRTHTLSSCTHALIHSYTLLSPAPEGL